MDCGSAGYGAVRVCCSVWQVFRAAVFSAAAREARLSCERSSAQWESQDFALEQNRDN